jgi:hypothetical protein
MLAIGGPKPGFDVEKKDNVCRSEYGPEVDTASPCGDCRAGCALALARVGLASDFPSSAPTRTYV